MRPAQFVIVSRPDSPSVITRQPDPRTGPDPPGQPGKPGARGPLPTRAGVRAVSRPLLASLRVGAEAAMEAIWGNKLRSGLTILGVVIGVASVIVLIAFAQGAKQEVTAQI